MRYYLVPVKDALPAIQAHFRAFPDDGVAPTAAELRQLVSLVYAFVPVSNLLIDFAIALTGKPSMN